MTAPVSGGEMIGERVPSNADQILSVVIVDDHQLLAESLRHHFESQPDIECHGTAGSIATALDLVARSTPDVLLLDHHLPDGDGVGAVHTFKQLQPQLAVVVMTASSADEVLLAALEAGVSGFVSKSRSLGELSAAVRAAAAGESVISPEMLARLLPRLSSNRSASDPTSLTDRELEVLGLLAEGLTNAAIASRLVVSVHTIRNHVSNLSQKLGAHSKLEALSIAVRRGLLPPR